MNLKEKLKPYEVKNTFKNYENEFVSKKTGKEIRVYVINADEDFDFRGAEMIGDYESIMKKAEELGTVYSLGYFQDELNDEELFLNNSFIYIQ